MEGSSSQDLIFLEKGFMGDSKDRFFVVIWTNPDGKTHKNLQKAKPTNPNKQKNGVEREEEREVRREKKKDREMKKIWDFGFGFWVLWCFSLENDTKKMKKVRAKCLCL